MLKIGKYTVRSYDNSNVILEKEFPKKVKNEAGVVVETGETRNVLLGYYPNISMALSGLLKRAAAEKLDEVENISELMDVLECIKQEIIESTKGLRFSQEEAVEASPEEDLVEDEEQDVQEENITEEA